MFIFSGVVCHRIILQVIITVGEENVVSIFMVEECYSKGSNFNCISPASNRQQQLEV
jgi:hypothetical protein